MKTLAVAKYKLKAKNIKKKKHKSIKIGLVSDLHDRDPRKVLRTLKKQKPDLVLLAGDIIERRDEDASDISLADIDSYQEISPLWSSFCNLLKLTNRFLYQVGMPNEEDKRYGRYFLKKVSSIAPTYYSKGNHEWYFYRKDIEIFEEHNVICVNNNDFSTNIKGIDLRIGGLPTMYDLDWLETFSKKEGIKVLICHHPEYYDRFVKTIGEDAFDLVVSGHAHGGQWRFFNQGILAPGQGLFPKYHHGKFGPLVISAGASNTNFLPRFGNPCEIVMIELKI